MHMLMQKFKLSSQKSPCCHFGRGSLSPRSLLPPATGSRLRDGEDSRPAKGPKSRGATAHPPAAPGAPAPLTSLAVGAAPAAPGSAPVPPAAAAGQGAGAAAAPRRPVGRPLPREGGRRRWPGAPGRGEAPNGAAGGGRRRSRGGGLRVTGGREAGGDLSQPAGSGDRPDHQRHHEAGECHGASPAGSGPSPPLIAPGMRRGKAGPRRPTNPPRRTPLPPSLPLPRQPRAPPPPPDLPGRPPGSSLPAVPPQPRRLPPPRFSPTSHLLRPYPPGCGCRGPFASLTKRSPGKAGEREQTDPRGGWRGRGMERAPDVSAGNKGSGNKRREEKCLRGFSFIPAPCALNSNLLIPNHCRVLHDLIISGFLFLPGWLSVSFASLSHIVQLLAWVRYCCCFFF